MWSLVTVSQSMTSVSFKSRNPSSVKASSSSMTGIIVTVGWADGVRDGGCVGDIDG